MKRCLAVLCLLSSVVCVRVQAATAIGSESAVSSPESSLWSTCLNFKPGDGETVALNPPQFSWSYVPNPTNMGILESSDKENKNFIFLIASDAGFTSLVFSNLTSWNFYNTLGPLATNTTLYWKIGYCHESNTIAYEWSAVRTFIVSNAVTWDRSLLTNETYLASNAVHPHFFLTASNRLALSNWLEDAQTAYLAATTNYVLYNAGSVWSSIKISAAAITNAASWPTNVPAGSGAYDFSSAVANVALCWAVSRNGSWSNAHPELALAALADHYMTNGYYRSDVISAETAGQIGRALAMGYDWCYDLMDSTQRSNVLYAIAMRCRWMLCGAGDFMWMSKDFEFGVGDATGVYTNGFYTSYASQAKLGHSHGSDNGYHSIFMALAAYGDHPWVRQLFDYGVNYMTGPTYCYGTSLGMGRSYMGVHLYSEQKALRTHITASAIFPELAFNRNPFWARNAAWWNHAVPSQFYEGHEPWGDSGYGYSTFWSDVYSGQELSVFLQDNRYWKRFNDTVRFYTLGGLHAIPTGGLMSMLTGFHFSSYTNLTETATPETSLCMTNEGWVMSGSKAPSAADAFTNGVGIIYAARPAGSITGHGFPCDGSFQIWAYGANVTDGGGLDAGGGYGPYGKVPWSHYTLLVNGYGQCQPQKQLMNPYYARITAYTNNTNFTFWSSDLTDAYPRQSFEVAGDTIPYDFAASHGGGPLSYVSQVTRSVLFQRQKYFVIYDTLQTDNAPTNTFTWIYHVNEPTLNLDTNSMGFSYTSTNTAPDLLGYSETSAPRTSATLNNALTMNNGDTLLLSFFGFVDSTNWADLVAVTNAVTFSDTRTNAYTLYGDAVTYFTNGSGIPYFSTREVKVGCSNSVALTNTDSATCTFPQLLLTRFTAYRQQKITVHVAHISTNLAVTDLTGTNVRLNPILGQSGWANDFGNDPPVNLGDMWNRSHALWFNNQTPTNQWHFLSVIYPVKQGESAPSITRIDDYTVAVTNGSEGDVISFDTNSAVATILVDVEAMNIAPTQRVAQPTYAPPGAVVDVLPTNITIICSTPGAVIHASTNGTDYFVSSNVWINSSQTLYSYATNADMLDSYITSTTFSTNNPALPTVGTPIFSPPGTSFLGETNFTLTCPTNGATIFYSLDGSAPSLLYSSAVTITESATAKAQATLADHNDSAIATATFTRTNAPESSGGITITASNVHAGNLIFR